MKLFFCLVGLLLVFFWIRLTLRFQEILHISKKLFQETASELAFQNARGEYS